MGHPSRRPLLPMGGTPAGLTFVTALGRPVNSVG